MSDFGMFLLMCVVIVFLIGLIKFLAWVSDQVEKTKQPGFSWRAVLSSISSFRLPDIMSRPEDAQNNPAPRPRTDAPADGRTEPQQPAPHPVTVDTARQLRAHGFTRDEARAFLKILGWTLGNDTWSKAQPEEEPQMTPVANRPTNATFRETGALAYKDPPQ